MTVRYPQYSENLVKGDMGQMVRSEKKISTVVIKAT